MGHAHIVPLMYKLKTSNKGSDDLYFGFDRDCNRRQNGLTNNKNLKGRNHLTNMLQNISGFAENQENATYGLGYKLTLTRNGDDAVIGKVAGTANARIKIGHIHWYVPRYTPSIQQRCIVSKQILSKTPTELRYFERFVFFERRN